MFFQLSLAAALIATTVIIQAVFMAAGLKVFRRIEKQKPRVMVRHHAITTVIWISVPADPNCSGFVGDVLLRKRRITEL